LDVKKNNEIFEEITEQNLLFPEKWIKSVKSRFRKR